MTSKSLYSIYKVNRVDKNENIVWLVRSCQAVLWLCGNGGLFTDASFG